MSGKVYINREGNILYWAEGTKGPNNKRIWRIALRCAKQYLAEWHMLYSSADLVSNYSILKLLSDVPREDLPLYVSWETKSDLFEKILCGEIK